MQPATVIEATSIVKSYGHIEALRGVSLTIHAGEILALVGDNGAGKSTFAKIVCGAVRPDSGELRVLGEAVRVQSIRHAHELGIQAVYQDLAQAPDLTVVENMFLGREVTGGGWRERLGVLQRRQMHEQTRRALRELGIQLTSLNTPIRSLSGGQRQALAVARAINWATTAILMDEPTAALGTKQTALVYDAISAAAQRGLAVVVISHDIPRMLELAHRVAVMRQGRVVAAEPASAVSLRDVIDLMLSGQRTA